MLSHCLTKPQEAALQEVHPDPVSPVVKMASVGRQSVVGRRVQSVFSQHYNIYLAVFTGSSQQWTT